MKHTVKELTSFENDGGPWFKAELSTVDVLGGINRSSILVIDETAFRSMRIGMIIELDATIVPQVAQSSGQIEEESIA
jgi:hypothetical protein